MNASNPPDGFDEEQVAERQAIRDASQALIDGSVEGPMTVTRLAELCGLKRWKLTHRHLDLKDAFQAAAGHTPSGRANGAIVEKRLAQERDVNRELRGQVAKLKGDLERYAMVIAELATDLADAQSRAEALSGVKRIGPRH